MDDVLLTVFSVLPFLAVAAVLTVAFWRRRRDRSAGSSPLVVNPYTLVIEPDSDRRGSLPVVQPAPSTTTSQIYAPPTLQPLRVRRGQP